MTLHEAIEQVLVKSNQSLSAKDIATILNKNSWYTKKDGSQIASSQIGARVKNYPHLFRKIDGLITLKSKTGILPKKPVKKLNNVSADSVSSDSSLLMKVLMNQKNFKSVKESEINIPDKPGLYCIGIKNIKALSSNLTKTLHERNHNIIYIGLASKSLKKRFLGQELRAKGHGTFFRSLGAVLGYRPETGSLVGMRNQNNYKFSKANEQKIISWINTNLIINWVAVEAHLNETESKLLNEYSPLLNIAGNPGKLNEVIDLRNECKRIARGID
ncbi:hypothetical protein SAMN05192545_1655 [Maribacter dokdonensis]|uniref:GIY-YIG catalytic domain-containing protein n=1 Tax=Maribacter dokdonensis TaxID=320912 RepID=A0ABY0UF54_9FLAO|nr:hypothetical protein [Maribacter dokdonensis]SDS58164.1 hypothetical protein SAMN05192545_1655 [Maribacter dokdonensis]